MAQRSGLLPLIPSLLLAALGFATPSASRGAFLATATFLLIWNAVLLIRARAARRELRIDVALRKPHYIQACVQSTLLLYWGWYWPPVFAYLPYLFAQLLFAYAFEALLVWCFRDRHTLGLGVFPIIFSINLFLWFKPEWFYLQFALVALGFAAKEFLRWEKEGRNVHIFNPSSFPLAVFSIALLLTNSTGLTRGPEIATTQFYPPQMYVALFLLGMPGQMFFGVTSMVMPAVLTTYAFSSLYYGATGVYFFYDSYIPISVFLGMHLLFTDPATAPRTALGRVVYGVIYGLTTVGLYQLLGMYGLPTFYDKLLQVPLMNLSIRAIDRAALRVSDALGHPRVWIPIWSALFAVLAIAGGLNDRHPGQWFPFWRQACQDGRAFACPYLADLDLERCHAGSGWACNEAGLMHVALSRSGEDTRRADLEGAAVPFHRGCELGFVAACANGEALARGSNDFAAPGPTAGDLPIILRGSKGELGERDQSKLIAIACKQGWTQLPQECQAD